MNETNAQLASRLASALWNVSALRHGMFTPPEFRELAEHFLLQELNRDLLADDPEKQLEAFRRFEAELALWRENHRQGEAPRKPKGYDLWKQGDNPFGLDFGPGATTS